MTWEQGLIRNLTKIVPGLLLFEILFTPFLSTAPSQRMSDKIAGTVVLQEKSVKFWPLVIKCSLICLLLASMSLVIMELAELVISEVTE